MTDLRSCGNRKSGLRRRNPTGFISFMDNFFVDEFPSKSGFHTNSFKVDIRDDEKEYVIEAEFPGVAKEDIIVKYDRDILTISIERVKISDEENNHYVHKERTSLKASRSIKIRNGDFNKVSGELSDGILKIKVPKKEFNENSNRIIIK